ncbi:hypothetical protein [Nonomuraea sp. NEAU-A123]|uniref:hypothetical protein n=1 Tax=Nonomuraea sp. NEAU-A123 TaxID=2839649 RepID=UPI001BE3FD20|nr:hypothetical protein [Nonomuraea sp. NEAU-A123]MBT2225986.1 hypothetical protein [Nonomuraea sp. NEAU-A123]
MTLSDYVRDWRPGVVTSEDIISPGPAAALAAVLDAPPSGEPLPLPWQWLYFLEWPAQARLGIDGHPAEGHFLPPIPHRRRMFAGGRMRARRGLEMGRPAVRTAELTAVTPKEGRSGEMLFVTVRYEYRQGGELRLVDEQDLVYRSDPPSQGSAPAAAVAGETAGADDGAAWRLSMTATPPLLFRFSALTANAHRIHYDLPYCTDVERYPGLVVHGPLLAVLMAELPRRYAPGRRITGLVYRLRRPVFAGEPIVITGSPESGQLTVQDAAGQLRAEAHFT